MPVTAFRYLTALLARRFRSERTAAFHSGLPNRSIDGRGALIDRRRFRRRLPWRPRGNLRASLVTRGEAP